MNSTNNKKDTKYVIVGILVILGIAAFISINNQNAAKKARLINSTISPCVKDVEYRYAQALDALIASAPADKTQAQSQAYALKSQELAQLDQCKISGN